MHSGCFGVDLRSWTDDLTGLGLKSSQEGIRDFYLEQPSGWTGFIYYDGIYQWRKQI